MLGRTVIKEEILIEMNELRSANYQYWAASVTSSARVRCTEKGIDANIGRTT